MNDLTLESLAKRLDTLERQVNLLLPMDSDPPGTLGDEQSNDPEAVRRWLDAFDAIPPLMMTVDEEAAWQTARSNQKPIDTSAIDQLTENLSGTK